MNIIIDYILTVFDKIVNALNSMKMPGGISFLYYLLGAIIISFVFRLFKGGAGELNGATNFSSISSFYKTGVRYSQSNRERKKQLVEKN